VIDIHPCDQTLSLASTGGMFTTNLKAAVPGYGLVWFSEKQFRSLSGMMNRFRVIMDFEVSNTMVVNTPKHSAFSLFSSFHRNDDNNNHNCNNNGLSHEITFQLFLVSLV
jgi:hypothetical protein